MPTRPLKIITESEIRGRSMFAVPGPNVAVDATGAGPDKAGNVDYSCGKCGLILMRGMGGKFIVKNAVIKCGKCGTLNEAVNTDEGSTH
jgi:hypothetical protein